MVTQITLRMSEGMFENRFQAYPLLCASLTWATCSAIPSNLSISTMHLPVMKCEIPGCLYTIISDFFECILSHATTPNQPNGINKEQDSLNHFSAIKLIIHQVN